MELGSVYANLGSKVVVVEALPGILTGADPDLVRPIMKYAEKNFRELRLNTKVTQMSTKGKKIRTVTVRAGQGGKGGILRSRARCRGARAALRGPRFGKHQS